MAKKKETKAQVEPDYTKLGHHPGAEGTGYTLLADGTYELAPCDRDEIDAVLADEIGLRAYVADVNAFLNKSYAGIARRKERWFERTHKNLRIEDKDSITYRQGVVRIKGEESKEPSDD
jgi:hypothetical protein